MTSPGWARWLLARLAGGGTRGEVIGDLEEAHRRRLSRRSAPVAVALTALDALDMARALLFDRLNPGFSWLDFKLGARMLVRYPGLTASEGSPSPSPSSRGR